MTKNNNIKNILIGIWGSHWRRWKRRRRPVRKIHSAPSSKDVIAGLGRR